MGKLRNVQSGVTVPRVQKRRSAGREPRDLRAVPATDCPHGTPALMTRHPSAPAVGRDSRQPTILRLLHAFTADPAGVSRALPGHIRMILDSRMHTKPHHGADEAWDEDLHSLLGAAWPCPQRQHLDELVAEIGALLAARGLGYGRQTYGAYSDGDSSLCRAVWCTVLHTRPEVVIETGVAHGVTSRVVLEALQWNDRGHLWSIDLPHPLDHRLHAQTGAAVSDACRPRWSYLEGSSSQRLPPLLAEVGHVEVFIHDSLHTARNTAFEMNQAASAMPPGGVMLVDDIKTHKGFAIFARRHPGYRTIVCPSADREGLFGIAVNAASA
jgi:Methyltransferase domain